MDLTFLHMRELLVIDDLRNSSFEIALQKNTEILAVNLLTDIVSDLFQDFL